MTGSGEIQSLCSCALAVILAPAPAPFRSRGRLTAPRAVILELARESRGRAVQSVACLGQERRQGTSPVANSSSHSAQMLTTQAGHDARGSRPHRLASSHDSRCYSLCACKLVCSAFAFSSRLARRIYIVTDCCIRGAASPLSCLVHVLPGRPVCLPIHHGIDGESITAASGGPGSSGAGHGH